MSIEYILSFTISSSGLTDGKQKRHGHRGWALVVVIIFVLIVLKGIKATQV